MRRILEITGIVALAAWTVAGFVFWSQVKERVVVQVGGTDGEGEAVRLLADDVQTLHGDLRGLASALETNLGKLAASLDASNEERTRAVESRLAAKLEALRSVIEVPRSPAPPGDVLSTLKALRAEVAALGRGLRELRPVASREALQPPEREARTPPPPTATEAPAQPASRMTPPVTQEAAQGAPPASQASPAPGPATRPRKSVGFLSFDLPSESFRFDARQRFKILPALSRVGFDASSTLHDFTGRTSDVSGTFILNPASLAAGCSGSVNVRSASLDTGNVGRDEEMRDLLHAKSHAMIRFELRAVRGSSAEARSATSQGTVEGTLVIGSVSKLFEMPVKISVDGSRRLVLKGQQKLALSTFGIEAPSQMGIVSMDDEVTVWIALRARAVGRAR